MRTNIIIDDELMAEAMALTNAKTKKEAVEAGLRQLIRSAKQRTAFDELAGIGWEGDLDAMRTGRSV